MRFQFVETLGLQINLSVLKRETQPYSILLYQHEGNLQADNISIRNHPSADNQLWAVIEKAIETNADLVLTPEYSCPWAIIDSIIENETFWPKPGKLWVFGCESITKTALFTFQGTKSKDNVYIHFDSNVLHKDGNYLDPLVYLFKAQHEQQDKLVVLIQFKTAHMGVWTSPVERNNLIEGDEIYILRNSRSSIHLLSLICSEAMNFPTAILPVTEDLQWSDIPYLLLNPQLNPNPTYHGFADFRKFLSNYDKKELISLNWTKSSTLLGHPLTTNNTSRSGFYLKSHEVDLTHQRIKQNHQQGIYYFSLGQQKHAYILNSSIHAFLVKNLSISITENLAVQQRRDGPTVNTIFSLNATKNKLEALPSSVTDYHLDYLNHVHCSCSFLLGPGNCIVEKEMLVSLTTGNINKALGASWNNVQNLFSLQSNEQTEPNNRITFIEDNYPENTQQREKYVDTINTLELQVFSRPELFPESIKDLKTASLQIGYHHNARNDGYKYNIITREGEKKSATIAFLGSAPESEINRKFDFLQGMFENDNRNRGRVVIFYSRGADIRSKFDPSAARISSTNDYEPTSILK